MPSFSSCLSRRLPGQLQQLGDRSLGRVLARIEHETKKCSAAWVTLGGLVFFDCGVINVIP
jgi:chorismate-pyruvate lyase